MLLRLLNLILVLCCTFCCAQPTLEVNIDPWGTGDWRSNPGSVALEEVEIRLIVAPGAWYCLLLGAYVDPRSELWATQSIPEWMRLEIPREPHGLFEGYTGDPGGPQVVVPSEVMQQGLNLMLKDPIGDASTEAVCDWGVPLLAGFTKRTWQCYPEIWSLPERGHGTAGGTIAIWEGMAAEFIDGVITEPSLMRVESMTRWAIHNQASLAGIDPDDFLDSEAYKLALEAGDLRLQIQGLTALGAIAGPGSEDALAPGLEAHPAPPALTGITRGPTLTVSAQTPSGTDTVFGLDGNFTEGSQVFFTALNTATPVMVGFPLSGGGHLSVQASPHSIRSNALRYAVTVPAGLGLGAITLSTGLNPNPVVVGNVTGIQ